MSKLLFDHDHVMQKKKMYRREQDLNLRAKIATDFKSVSLTTRTSRLYTCMLSILRNKLQLLLSTDATGVLL
jgi:hypothetical protein